MISKGWLVNPRLVVFIALCYCFLFILLLIQSSVRSFPKSTSLVIFNAKNDNGEREQIRTGTGIFQ